MVNLQELLRQSAELHRHLCPRQVLGVRMGLAAGQLLGLSLPQADKRLLTIVETDGCFTDGVAVAANCWVGRRTLRVLDYGKVAEYYWFYGFALAKRNRCAEAVPVFQALVSGVPDYDLAVENAIAGLDLCKASLGTPEAEATASP